ncbi:Acetyl esterase/lipase [Streptoalloteichus tenebrarius]|uniref:Acetyl esterase/lipase n=1 Tax=Streptoalloteichus tenebrarius (strain ATCC 17920 / DSM 40477 / JCM 4838 / CBS 697.72 / NBRC 16177 / NCIMB 11028 / NRRL B-12390 / A12253. 1 / ISP 5477) TaxID=1933 RepID=A0ABT1HQB1_STRSD|nr:alpha/beta hydrolase [Streptoalloteichus tenebrarius]MCP2257683.1 Acetyl esterase/lipase [Streptoalloteichus tenebrarius]BFE98643.1 alpha/beta hydrolase [Streptoalloteichus tenebrarius]
MQLGLRSLIDPALAAHVDEIRAANAASAMRRGPSNLDELRAARAQRDVVPSDADSSAVEEVVEAAGRRVPVRILTPGGAAPRGVHLDIHGGGFYMGTAARGDARNQQLADALGVAVVSVDYRLAPEHPWPAAPDDCETAALWLLEQAEARFGTTRLTVGGFSAGATLVMTTLLRLRDRGLAGSFTGAALEYGTYDMSGLTPAGRLIADEYFIQAYAGHVADRTIPDVSPIYGDLRGLPPLLMVVGSADILLEDNMAMAARVSAAGGSVDLRIYPEAPHGFTLRPTGMAKAALRDIERWLAECFSPASP